MPLPDGHRAQVTFQATNWSGWDPDGYSIVTYAKLFVAKGSRLNPATLGLHGEDGLFYELEIERIVDGRVLFQHRNLVIQNPDGTINLSAPRTGHFILRAGEAMLLSTATMDAGTSISVTVEEIR